MKSEPPQAVLRRAVCTTATNALHELFDADPIPNCRSSMTGPWVCATGVHQVHRSTKASVLHVPTRSERFKDRRGGEFERRKRVAAIGYTDRVLANYRAGFQERGGPRSVSREPIEETTIIESNGTEFLAVRRSGAEISNVGRVTNCN